MNFLAINVILVGFATVDWTSAQNVQVHPCANRYNVSSRLLCKVNSTNLCLQVFAADASNSRRFYWCSGSTAIVSYCSQDRRFVESLQYCMPIEPSTSTTSNPIVITSSQLPITTSRVRTPSRQTRTLPSRAPRTTRTTTLRAAALNAPVTQRPRPTRMNTVRY